MADETKTYVFGQDNNLLTALMAMFSQKNCDPTALMALAQNNGFGGNGGFLWFFFIIIIFAMLRNGFGGNNGNSATEFLSSQLNNTAGRDFLSQAISGVGGSVERLAASLNCDINTVQTGLNSLMGAVQSVGNSVNMSGLQTINAIERGDASLAAQFAQCCCDQKLIATQQGYENRIAIADQTNVLGRQADVNTRSITDAIAAQTALITKEFCEVKEREMLNKIESLTAANTALRGQIDNSAQTAQITGYINSLFVPLQKEVTEIKNAQPNTVSVPWPNLTAINTTPSLYGLGYGFGWGGYGNNGSIWA